MSDEDLTKLASLAMETLLDANRVIKRQAEERHVIYCKLVELSMRNSGQLSPDLKEIMEEHFDQTFESEFFKKQKLAAVNKLIGHIDQKEAKRDQLLREIQAIDENLKSRDELIGILKEYIDMEEASIYRLVENYNDAQEILEEVQESGKIFELLSANDPRMKALQTIQSHPQGISVLQLSFMLGTTQYSANKIINELIGMELITRKDQLIKIANSDEPVEKLLLNLTV